MSSRNNDVLETVTAFLTKLASQFSQSPETKQQAADYFRVLYYVQNEAANDGMQPVTNYIASLINTGQQNLVDMYLENVIEDTKKAKHDDQYRQFMKDFYSAMMNLGRGIDGKIIENPQFQASELPQGFFRGVQIGFAALNASEMEIALNTLETIAEINVSLLAVTRPLQQIGTVVKKVGGKVVVALVAIELSYHAMKNIYQWWNGEISGAFCAKSMVDACGVVGGGLVGGLTGAKVGALLGPLGAVVGGTIGTIAGQQIGKVGIEKITCKIFNLPPTAALDNAYRHIGVCHTASNEDVNKAYKKMALKTHPDQGGSHEKFLELQYKMGIIKVARGELY